MYSILFYYNASYGQTAMVEKTKTKTKTQLRVTCDEAYVDILYVRSHGVWRVSSPGSASASTRLPVGRQPRHNAAERSVHPSIQCTTQFARTRCVPTEALYVKFAAALPKWAALSTLTSFRRERFSFFFFFGTERRRDAHGTRVR